MNRILLWTAAALLAFDTGCRRANPAPPHTVLLEDLSPLRAQFNADSGKVRAIFLASPT